MSQPFNGITPQMEDRALIMRAVTLPDVPQRESIAQDWVDIFRAINAGGPFARMMLAFRDEATEAMGELLLCAPGDAQRIAMLQGKVDRLLGTIHHINTIRELAEQTAADTPSDADDLPQHDIDYLTRATGDE